jgi:hypothetical protein
MPSRDEYPDDAVQACFSVLLELFTYLKPYRDYIVLIGGWVPFFLTKGKTEEPHIGTLDIDLALDANRLPATGYATILTILENRHYRPAQNKNGEIIPARYERSFQFPDGRTYHVPVDFLSPEYGGTGSQHRHQKVQELLARKARGSDLVFDHFVEREIGGRLPNRAENHERIKIANPAACLVMKAIAFGDRSAEKDAYDMYMLCEALGVPTLIAQLTPLKLNKLMQEALAVLREKFRSPNALGPVSVVDFVNVSGDEAERLKRRAFEFFQAIVSGLR